MIIFDLDNTLFNTALLKGDICRIFEKYEVRGQEFWKSFYKSYDVDIQNKGGYNIEKHLSLLDSLTPERKENIKQEIESLVYSRGTTYLYSEVLAVLSALKNTKKEKVVLVSKGDKDFQQLKIDATGLASYFDEIFIIEADVMPTLAKLINKCQEGIIFINDKVEELRSIQKKFPDVFCVFMRREGQAEPKDFSVPSVTNLNELSWYLRTLQFK